MCTLRMVDMNTELAFDRHRKVDLGFDFDFVSRTARIIAGCWDLWLRRGHQNNIDIEGNGVVRTTGMILSAPSICSLVPPFT